MNIVINPKLLDIPIFKQLAQMFSSYTVTVDGEETTVPPLEEWDGYYSISDIKEVRGRDDKVFDFVEFCLTQMGSSGLDNFYWYLTWRLYSVKSYVEIFSIINSTLGINITPTVTWKTLTALYIESISFDLMEFMTKLVDALYYLFLRGDLDVTIDTLYFDFSVSLVVDYKITSLLINYNTLVPQTYYEDV